MCLFQSIILATWKKLYMPFLAVLFSNFHFKCLPFFKVVISLTLYSFNWEGKVGYSPGHSGGSWNCMIWKKGEGGSSPKLFSPQRILEKLRYIFRGRGYEEKKNNAGKTKTDNGVKRLMTSSVFVSLYESRGKRTRVFLLLFRAFCSFPDCEDLHHQRRWDVSELCLVEMDRLYPSENMASASRGLVSFPVCLWRSAAWKYGAPRLRRTAARVAVPVPLTAAVHWGPSSPASSTAPTSGWKGPLRRKRSRWPPMCCK